MGSKLVVGGNMLGNMQCIHSTPTQVSAMSPATIHGIREARMDHRVMIAVASFVVTGALVTMGDFIVRFAM